MAETSSELPFFSQLKKLASKVERGVTQYDAAFKSGRNEEFCAPQTLKTITDMQKELKQMNRDIQEKISKQDAENAQVNAILCLAKALRHNIQSYVDSTESYVQQYGYVPCSTMQKTEEKEGQKDLEDDAEEDDDAQEGGCNTPPMPKAVPKKVDKSRTPQLEDAGISEYTMQLLSNMAKKQHLPAQPRQVKQQPPWPSEFEHNGIICTPSLTGRFENSMMDMHEALASPIFNQNQETKACKVEDMDPSAKLEFDRASDSPVPPKFLTPGMKQILDKGVDELSGKPAIGNSKRAVNGCLFKTDSHDIAGKQSGKAGFQSPQDDDLPQEPELTYSLEALTEMTGMFRINPKPPATSAQTLPRLAPQSVQSENKENATPPEPTLLSSKQSRVKDMGSHSSSLQKTLHDELPPSPKFLGKYDFLKIT